jgi:hypothetical protein
MSKKIILTRPEINKRWVEKNKDRVMKYNIISAARSHAYKIANNIEYQFKLLRKMDIF